jgi:hypothetical protein
LQWLVWSHAGDRQGQDCEETTSLTEGVWQLHLTGQDIQIKKIT